MAWYQHTYHTTLAEKDALEDALIAAGAVSVTIQSATDEPIFELEPDDRPMWHNLQLTALTSAEVTPESFFHALNQHLSAAKTPINTEFLPDKDWTREWMDQFQPIACGERLWIVPSWHEAPQQQAVNLILDPGLAFGSGTHPTTFMCLRWLDQHIRGGETVLDYGCGSGVLAIAAALLGAQQTTGTDIDPQAVIASHDNADRNHVTRDQFSACLCEEHTDAAFDIVVANILANPLVGLSSTLAHNLRRGGKLILSGILAEQADSVIDAYALWITLTVVNREDGWVLLAGSKP